MAIIPGGTRFDAIRVNAQFLNRRSLLTNTNDPTYSIEDLASTIGNASVGPQGPAGDEGPIGLTGPVGLTGLDWQGPWVSGTNYTTTDAVGYNGASWFCIANISGGTVAPNVDTTHWALLAAQGSTGPAGANGGVGPQGNAGPVGLLWQGAWVSATQYGLSDAVFYDGSAYYCTSATLFSSTTPPDLDPTNWSLMAQQGIQGIQGVAGPTGANGIEWEGVWVFNGYYQLNDAVSFNGSSYISISAIPFNSTITPNADPVNWELLAEKGADGTSGGGLAGDSFIYVDASYGTEVDNGSVLINAVQQAIFADPYGNPKSNSNRMTVLVPPGNYDLGTNTLTLTTSFINVVSLTGNRDVTIKTSSNTAVIVGDEVKLIGIKTDKKITVNSGAFVEIENCQAGYNSFGAENFMTLVGTFKNCESLGQSFGWGNNLTIGATFIDCKSGAGSFGFGNNNSIQGTFINCTADTNSFGSGINGNISGTFIDCTAGQNSFGYASSGFVILQGTFKNCTAGASSFGSGRTVTVSSIITDCTAGPFSFGNGFSTPALVTIDSSTFTNCTSNNDSFGAGKKVTIINSSFDNCEGQDKSFGYTSLVTGPYTFNMSSTFTNCKGGANSFGAGNDLTLAGSFTNCTSLVSSFGFGTNVVTSAAFTDCVAGAESFGSGIGCTAGGEFRNCKGGLDSFGSGDTSSKFQGTAYNCQAGDNSFGGSNLNLQGVLIGCTLTAGTFKTIDPSSGVTRLCIDGSYVLNNQP